METCELSFKNDSWIEEVSYNPVTKEMVIQMKGGEKNRYACENVPLEVYMDFKNADSKGSFFNHNIKGRYLNTWFK